MSFICSARSIIFSQRKNSYFPLRPGATGSLQITPSGSGDENDSFHGRSFPKS